MFRKLRKSVKMLPTEVKYTHWWHEEALRAKQSLQSRSIFQKIWGYRSLPVTKSFFPVYLKHTFLSWIHITCKYGFPASLLCLVVIKVGSRSFYPSRRSFIPQTLIIWNALHSERSESHRFVFIFPSPWSQSSWFCLLGPQPNPPNLSRTVLRTLFVNSVLQAQGRQWGEVYF